MMIMTRGDHLNSVTATSISVVVGAGASNCTMSDNVRGFGRSWVVYKDCLYYCALDLFSSI